MSKKTKYATPTPSVSAKIAGKIRLHATQYLQAGGGLFLPNDGGGEVLTRHLNNVRHYAFPEVDEDFQEAVKQHTKDREAHEAIWSAGYLLEGAASDAGFLFGVQVGLAVAALSLGTPVKNTVGKRPRTARRATGGAR